MFCKIIKKKIHTQAVHRQIQGEIEWEENTKKEAKIRQL